MIHDCFWFVGDSDQLNDMLQEKSDAVYWEVVHSFNSVLNCVWLCSTIYLAPHNMGKLQSLMLTKSTISCVSLKCVVFAFVKFLWIWLYMCIQHSWINLQLFFFFFFDCCFPPYQDWREAHEDLRAALKAAEDLLPEIPMKQVDVEQFEIQQRQRRYSLQTRRTSLADCIPDWPTLQKRKAPEKVDPRVPCWYTRFEVQHSENLCPPPSLLLCFVLEVSLPCFLLYVLHFCLGISLDFANPNCAGCSKCIEKCTENLVPQKVPWFLRL